MKAKEESLRAGGNAVFQEPLGSRVPGRRAAAFSMVTGGRRAVAASAWMSRSRKPGLALARSGMERRPGSWGGDFQFEPCLRPQPLQPQQSPTRQCGGPHIRKMPSARSATPAVHPRAGFVTTQRTFPGRAFSLQLLVDKELEVKVPGTGVEPALLAEPDPKSGASANSAIPAADAGYWRRAGRQAHVSAAAEEFV